MEFANSSGTERYIYFCATKSLFYWLCSIICSSVFGYLLLSNFFACKNTFSGVPNIRHIWILYQRFKLCTCCYTESMISMRSELINNHKNKWKSQRYYSQYFLHSSSFDTSQPFQSIFQRVHQWWIGCNTARLWMKLLAVAKIKATKMKTFPRYWPFVQGTHRSPVNGRVNNCEAVDLRRHLAHYDVIVMFIGSNVRLRMFLGAKHLISVMLYYHKLYTNCVYSTLRTWIMHSPCSHRIHVAPLNEGSIALP